MVSSEIERDSIVVFDEAHNIDNVSSAADTPLAMACVRIGLACCAADVWPTTQVCIEALSINLDKRQLDLSSRNIGTLRTKVNECVSPWSWPPP